MSVYKPKGSRFFIYDFERGGRRFWIDEMRRTDGRPAHEEGLILDAERKAEIAKQAVTQARGEGPMTLAIAAARFFHEVGQHHAHPRRQSAIWMRTVDPFGRGKCLQDITDEEVSRWVAERRGEQAVGRTLLVSSATVNRTTVDTLRKVFGRARRTWKLRLDNEPEWFKHRLKERGEMVASSARMRRRRLCAGPSGWVPRPVALRLGIGSAACGMLSGLVTG